MLFSGLTHSSSGAPVEDSHDYMIKAPVLKPFEPPSDFLPCFKNNAQDVNYTVNGISAQ